MARKRLADVSVELHDGRTIDSGPTRALGDPDLPFGAPAVRHKFHRFAESACSERQTKELGSNDAPIAPLQSPGVVRSV